MHRSVADAFGYVGSVVLLLYRSFAQAELSWLEFFVAAAYATGGVALLVYFAQRLQGMPEG